jgi:hypothetical protein
MGEATNKVDYKVLVSPMTTVLKDTKGLHVDASVLAFGRLPRSSSRK